ncbi:hypothetical protein BDR22DRAFT_974662 [Usnea florida]
MSTDMPGAFKEDETPASPLLPRYQTDIRDDERNLQREDSSTNSEPYRRAGLGWLRKCYESVQRLVGSRDEAVVRDKEAVETDGRASIAALPARFEGESFRGNQRRNANHDVDEVENSHTTQDEDNQPLNHSLSRLAIASELPSRLLSDQENDRINAKIDKLIAAINERRPLHFAPITETGDTDIYADYDIENEVVGQDEDDIERDIANSPDNFGRILRSGNGVQRIKSPSSLLYASSTGSWTSTTDSKSSSNAWERAVAAANIRFAIENKNMGEEAVIAREPFHSEDMTTRIPFQRRLVHDVSPVPLYYNKAVRSSTPSVHSNGSELDTSSPLFRKSCERVRRDTYAVPPESTFERGYSQESRLDDEWAFVTEPPDNSPKESTESKALAGKGRAFGVFDDAEIGTSSRAVEKPDIPTKALKDISNLRRPGYLQFNSFAKEAKSTKNSRDTVVPITASSAGFEGAPDPDSRRAYIKKKWPGLLQDHNNTPEPPQLDGVARRRNEQAIGHAIDTSHYSLSHVRTSMADSSLNIAPARQAHFDLALARLEGRALPPPRSPIQRYPDSAALFDRDILVEGSDRPLPLRGPRPTNTTPHRVLWRNFG